MKFDASQFEQKISGVIGALDKLNAKIKTPATADGLNAVSASVQKLSSTDMPTLSASIESIHPKLLSLGTMGVTAVNNLTNSVLNSAKAFASNLLIKPITDGFGEYELKMGSIQTILANTAKYGTTLDQVKTSLGALNDYSDKTIYNFGDMTRNIGLFTNAGIRLEEATSMIKGFSNAAAASGTNSQGAAGAAYQLSQALSAGTIRLMDWRSLTNVGMGNKNMQQGLVDIAEAMGELSASGYTASDVMSDFNGSLEKNWLSADVMKNYLTIMSQENEGLNREMMKSIGLSDAQIDNFVKQQKTAEEAATKVRTWTQLIGTIGESIGSGWAETFELILGDFNEATDLFTNINNVVGDIVGATNAMRNNALKDWIAFGGKAALFEGLGNVFKGITSVLSNLGAAFRAAFAPLNKGKILIDASAAFRDFTRHLFLTGKHAENFQNTFKGVFAVFALLSKIVGGFVGVFAKFFGAILKATGPVAGGIFTISGAIGKAVFEFEKFIERSRILDKVFNVLGKIAVALGTAIRRAFTGVATVIGGVGFVLYKFGDIVAKVVEAVIKGIGGIPKIIDAVRSSFKSLGDFVARQFNKNVNLEPARRAFVDFATAVKTLFSKSGIDISGITTAFERLGGVISRQFGRIDIDFAPVQQKLTNFAAMVERNLTPAAQKVKSFARSVEEDLTPAFQKASAIVGRNVTKMMGYLTDGGAEADLKKYSGVAKGFIDSFVNEIKGGGQNIKASVREFYNTLAGHFNAGKAVLMGVWTSVADWFSKTGGDLGAGFSKIMSDISQFFATIDQRALAFKENFERTILAAKIILSIFGDQFKIVMDKIRTAMGKIPGMHELVEAWRAFFGVIKAGMPTIKADLADIFGPMGESLFKMGEKLASFFKKIGENIKGVLTFGGAVDTQQLFGGLSLAMLATFVLQMVQIVSNFREFHKIGGSINGIFTKVGDIAESIKGTLDGVKKSISAFTLELKSKAILNIALAIGVLALSLIALSRVPKDKLTGAVEAMALVGVGLLGLMKALDTLGSGGLDMLKTVGYILILSVALTMLTAALVKMAKLSWEEIARGLTAVTALIIGVTASTLKMSDNSMKMMEGSISLLFFAKAVGTLGDVVMKLSKMDAGQIARGLAVMTAIIANMAMFFRTSNVQEFSFSAGLGLIALSVSMHIFASAIEKIGAIDTDKLLKGMAAITVIFAGLGAMFAAMSSNNHVLSQSVGILVFSAAMIVFSVAMERIGSMPTQDIVKALSAITIALGVFAVTMSNFPQGTIKNAVAISMAMLVLAHVFSVFAALSIEDTLTALVGMGGAMLILAFSLNAMTGTAGGAAALLVAAAAMVVLGGAMAIIGSLPIEAIGIALLGMAGAMMVFIVAGYLLQPVAVALLVFGAAINLIGAGLFLAGAGLFLFASGMVVFAAAAGAFTGAMLAVGAALIKFIPMLAQELAKGITAFLTTLAESMPKIKSSVIAIGKGIIETLGELLPDIVKLIKDLVILILDALIAMMPKLGEAIVVFLNTVLTIIQSVWPVFVETIRVMITSMITSFLETLRTMIPRFIEVGAEIFNALVLAGLDVLRVQTAAIMSTLAEIATMAIQTICDVIVTSTTTVVETVTNLIHVIVEAIVSMVGYLVDAGFRILMGFLDGIQKNQQKAIDKGTDIVVEFIKGIENSAEKILTAGKNAILKFLNGTADAIRNSRSEFDAAGRNIANAIGEGITGGLGDWVGNVVESARNLAGSALDTMRSILKINSPSKVTRSYGHFVGEGLVVGMASTERQVEIGSASLADTVINGMQSVASAIAAAIDTDLDASPTIAPVLDLSELTAGARTIGSVLNDGLMINPTASLAGGILSAQRVSAERAAMAASTQSETHGTVINFEQNLHSPKPLSRLEIYRQTQNQLAMVKGVVGK